MKRKTVNSQLSNMKTYINYRDKMLILAENVFTFKNINNFIDMAVVNHELVCKGSVAFFIDDVTKELLALPYVNLGDFDFYGRPTKIKVVPIQGTYNRILNSDEFVIMYDNESKIPIWMNILSSAERMASIKRSIDINIAQQKMPRFFKTSEENKKTVEDIVNEIDANVNTVVTYDNININDTTCVLAPSPYVADKLNMAKREEWAEFLELIGISNISVNKKERVIKDEIESSMGGTIASRYSRYESRRKAIEEINKKFNQNIEVEFYDGLPTTIASADDYLNDSNESNEEGVI